MNLKITALVLGWASALGISYFAFDILTSLGDWGHAWATEPLALIVAIVVTAPPMVAAWMGIIMVEQAKKTRGILWWFLGTTIFAWLWLYVGAIILALIRLQ